VAPLRQVTTLRRRQPPEVARQRGKSLVAHQLLHGRVTRGQRPLGRRRSVGEVGLQAALEVVPLARRLGGPALHGSTAGAVERAQQALLTQQLALAVGGVHSAASA
jgi:hypothetical protein